jgi:hypothetical protein
MEGTAIRLGRVGTGLRAGYRARRGRTAPGRCREIVVKHLKAFVGLVALCAALGTGAAATATSTVSSVGQAPNIRLRAGTSTNWSGYAVSGTPGSFHNVSASWVQPSVDCSGATQNTYSAYWVGLDGDTTKTVEQLGTEADCIGGQPQYSSWYEMYPQRSFPTPLTVTPGHTYSASVVAMGGGNFQLTLQDLSVSKSQPFTTVQKLGQAKLASAEAIVEAPSGGKVLALSNFGTAKFSVVTVNGSQMSPSTAEEITMVNPAGATKAQPSSLSGGAFNVAWVSAT